MIRKSPGLFLLAFVVSGIVLADVTHIAAEWLLPLAIATALIGIASFRRSATIATVALALTLLSFSAFEFALRYYDLGPRHLGKSFQPGERYLCYGEVVDWPMFKPTGTQIKIALDSLQRENRVQPVRGGLLLNVYDSTTALQRGDRVVFEVRLHELTGTRWPSDFDYGRFMNLKGVFATAYVDNLHAMRVDRGGRWMSWLIIGRLRSAITAVFQEHLSPASAALASGFLIGETRNIPPDVYQMFRDSGTLHLLAVSGSNVALVILFVIVALRPLRIGRRWRAVILLMVIAIFDLLCYAEPSVMRASIMAALVILVGLLERRYDLNNIIALAALIILLGDPAQLFSVGFQLSFLTAWGLIAIVPRATRIIKQYLPRRWFAWLFFPFLVTLVAQVASAPVLAFYFHRIPMIAPLANLIVVPLVSAAVISSIALLAVDLILPWATPWCGTGLDWLMQVILTAVRAFGGDHVPMFTTGSISIGTVLACYVFLAMIVIAVGHKRARRWAVIATLVAANLSVGTQLLSSRDVPWRQESYVFRIPGGVGLLLHRRRSERADLVITDARARRYPLEERILAPALTAVGADRLGWLVIRAAEYDALDDLLRLAATFQADSIAVVTHLHRAMLDQNRLLVSPFEPGRIKPVPLEGLPSGSGPGLSFSPDGLMISDPPWRTLFLYRKPDNLQLGDDLRSLVVIGGTCHPSWEDQTRMSEMGCEVLVCSKVAQVVDDTSTFHPQTRFLWDLSRTGAVRIRFAEDSSRSIMVESLR